MRAGWVGGACAFRKRSVLLSSEVGRTFGQLPSLHYGPALVGDQQDRLDAHVVLVVQLIGDVLFQISPQVVVALIQQGVDNLRVCKAKNT